MATRYVGKVKSWNPSSGSCGEIECPQTYAIYGRHVKFMAVDLGQDTVAEGDPVSFQLQSQGQWGPQACNISVLFRVANLSSPTASASSSSGKTQEYGQRDFLQHRPAGVGMQATVSDVDDSEQVYVGTIKSFSAERGWGHVQHDTLCAAYHKPIFMLKSVLQGQPCHPGDEITFRLGFGRTGPEVKEVIKISAPGGRGDGSRTYYGVVTAFDGQKGCGFVHCDELRQTFGKDVFLHRRVIKDRVVPNVGDKLQFSVTYNKIRGKPEISQAVVTPSGYRPSFHTIARASPY